MKKATKKDAQKFLGLINKWADRIGEERWAGVVTVCKCKEHNDSYAHTDYCSRSHLAWVSLHHVDDIERTALHEHLHLVMAGAHRVVQEMDGATREQWACAYEWYRVYEDQFITQMTKTLLDMDREIRRLKRKIKKLESA